MTKSVKPQPDISISWRCRKVNKRIFWRDVVIMSAEVRLNKDNFQRYAFYRYPASPKRKKNARHFWNSGYII